MSGEQPDAAGSAALGLLENDKLPPTQFLSIRVLEPTAGESVKYLKPTLACESPWMDCLAPLPPWETARVYFSIMVMLRGPPKLEDESAAAAPRCRARGARMQNGKHRRHLGAARLVSGFSSWLEAFASIWGSQRSNKEVILADHCWLTVGVLIHAPKFWRILQCQGHHAAVPSRTRYFLGLNQNCIKSRLQTVKSRFKA